MEDWKAKYIFSQISSLKTTNKHEMAILSNVLYSSELLELMPIIQKYVPIQEDQSRRYVDLYYPQLQLAIEVDENYHQNQRTEDDQRQSSIERALNCSFKRYDCSAESNHHEIIRKIIVDIKLILDQKRDQIEKWTEPSIKPIQTILDELENAIIFQGKTDSERGFFYPSRRINEENRNNSVFAIGLSASTLDNSVKYVTTVLEIDNWIQDSSNLGFWFPEGHEIEISGLTMSAYNGWPVGKDYLVSEKPSEDK